MSMLLSHRAVSDFLGRDFDNMNWMKKLAREQIMVELRRMRVRPKFKTEPWLHQLVCFWIGLHYPRYLYLLDMGTGKTKIILDIITQLQREKALQGRSLVTVPRKINLDSWGDDIERHSDLEPWLIKTQDIEGKWQMLAEPQGDIVVIDYQSLHWALSKRKGGKGKGSRSLVVDEKRVQHVQKLYKLVSIDESHKLSNHESLWFKLLRRLTHSADYTYATTGTLFGRDVQAIWPQFFLVDRGETFGPNMGLFRSSFFSSRPNEFGRGEKYDYNKRMDEQLNVMLQNRSIRYDENEVHDLPPRVQRVEHFSMTDEQRKHYMLALEGLINAQGNIQEMEGQWVQMRRIVSGYLKWQDDLGSHTVRFKENPKLEGLERLIDEVGGRSKIVVCYDYTETGKMICDLLESMHIGFEWFYGGTKDKSASRRRFMEDDRCTVFVMNSEAGGTGNDGLQKVAHYMFLYETPTPPITRKQTIKRIHRPGQTERTFIYDMVMRGSLDQSILNDIAENRDTYDSVVNGKRRPGRGFFLGE